MYFDEHALTKISQFEMNAMTEIPIVSALAKESSRFSDH